VVPALVLLFHELLTVDLDERDEQCDHQGAGMNAQKSLDPETAQDPDEQQEGAVRS
jgi:hypothetical protein